MSSCTSVCNDGVALNPQDPSIYHEKATVQQERALENLAGWTFDPDDLVLDIGAGNGKITASIAQQTPYGSTIGLDILPEMCQFAREKYPLDQYSNLDFIVGNACKLNYHNAFNKVTSFATLSWIRIEDHQQIFNGISNALKPGGKALLRMSSVGDRPLNRAVEEVIKKDLWKSFFEGFVSPAAYQSEECLREIVSQTTLEVIRLEDATKVSTYNNKQAFQDWLMTWEPHRNRVPEDMKNAFMAEVVDCFCEMTERVDQISITLPGLLIEVQKKLGLT